MFRANLPRALGVTFTFRTTTTLNPLKVAVDFIISCSHLISREVVKTIPTANFFLKGILIPSSSLRISRKNGWGISVKTPEPSPVSLSADIAPR